MKLIPINDFETFEKDLLKEYPNAKVVPLLKIGERFFSRYYFANSYWTLVVVVYKNTIIGCTISSRANNFEPITSFNIEKTRDFKELLQLHNKKIENSGKGGVAMNDELYEIAAKRDHDKLLKKIGIKIMPLATGRKKSVVMTYAIPNGAIFTKVAKDRATILCPNCGANYLYFRGVIKGLGVVSCRHCGICYYK